MPPVNPYVVSDSLAERPWFPSGESRNRSLKKRQASQKDFDLYTGSQDLEIGQCSLYRMRFILAGTRRAHGADLAD